MKSQRSRQILVRALIGLCYASFGSKSLALDAETKSRITDTRNCKSCRLTGESLTGLDLKSVSFEQADMRGMNLAGFNLSRAMFKGAERLTPN